MSSENVIVKLLDYVKDAALWFWLSVAGLFVMLLDAWSFAPLSQIGPGISVIVRVCVVVTLCLWLYALMSYKPLKELISTVQRKCVARFTDWQAKRRLRRIPKGAQEKILKILGADCAERRFLVFYVFHPAGTLSDVPRNMIDRPTLVGAKGLLSMGLLNFKSAHSDYYLHPRLVNFIQEKYRDDSVIHAVIDKELQIMAAKSHPSESLREDRPAYQFVAYLEGRR